MVDDFYHQPVTYVGPWQFYGRDIDPTLPPPHRLRNKDNDLELSPTFSEDEAWWKPPGPHYRRDDPPITASWAVESEADIPEFDSLVRRKDGSGTRWVVLHAQYYWEDEETRWRPCRQLWSRIDSWLIQPVDRDTIIAYLQERSLVGSVEHTGCEYTDSAYLGEVPWAPKAEGYSDFWCPIEPRADSDLKDAVEVYPAWAEYLWESQVLDCSISDAVRVCLPALILFNGGKLTWVPGTREWHTPDGTLVARCFEDDRRMALLVREDWLKRALRKTGHSMVFGWCGEKQLIGAYFHYDTVVGWMEFDGIASLVGNQWKFGKRRTKRRSRGA